MDTQLLLKAPGKKITYCEPAEKWFVILKPDDSISTAVIFQDPNLPRNTPKILAQLLSEPYKTIAKKVVINHYSNVEKSVKLVATICAGKINRNGACVFAEFDHEAEAQAVFRQNQKHFLVSSLKDSMCLPCTQC